MSVPAPHFILRSNAGASTMHGWRFVLQSTDGQARLEAQDDEPESSSERRELLAIVRGLESLDEPARVTILSSSRSISRSFRLALKEWRESDWQWEHYGQLAPVKNADLWRRIDRAAGIHSIECCDHRGTAADDLADPSTAARPAANVPIIRQRGRRLRIDVPAEKHETPSTKHETNPKCKSRNDTGPSLVLSVLRYLKLFRISNFVLRIVRVSCPQFC